MKTLNLLDLGDALTETKANSTIVELDGMVSFSG